MSEWFFSLGPVEWFREQFAQCPEGATNCDSITAAEMFQFVFLAWLVAAAVFIALDRLGSGLLGRSRPLAQAPPTKARTWRWGRKTPPENYSLLPPGTTVQRGEPPALQVETIDRPALTTGDADQEPTSSLSALQLPAGELEDPEVWKSLALASAPIFGLENHDRLANGQAPERYNPISGLVESLERNEDGTLKWPWSPKSTHVVGTPIDSESGHLEEEE